ncbi:inorganic phosphate transporter [Pantoea dispersa]|uniref:inorganic phosphate transporter n=1 Tax=Pantoea dispersa TaxID=59814 RepID=UPI001C04C85F|nr:inorganic phosphate transporter [Pantoea dispersa]MCW0320853.1 Low-affinity inorganic phosphate transporter 1 [Pantoea dispersa]MCW0325589.1 Low-affinity inorganic phosphate transporter 1 [Pantoea dispersa]MCW0430682.1 Low-affinity inorganic phosphate transporter 1 [Pantoea dispersa]QZY89299.1 inorganic phosphate transporter [Pantoea dispersa]
MAENSFPASSSARGRPNLHPRSGRASRVLFLLLLVAGLLFTGINLFNDVEETGAVVTSYTPFLLLGVALLIALGFEFVNGFHDTANAVATVIYTHSLSPGVAVVWSGLCNFLGVLLSSGVVAFGIISLLPVELILQAGSGHGFAMVYALLCSAIVWNLGTWYFGLPSSSSHTLIGSIIGVGVANALLHGRSGTSGVDWDQAIKVGYALLLSPVIGFICAAVLLLAMKALVRNRQLYQAPEGNQPPPAWIRGLLILTCTGVSFAHGSNDGQKGMGLIMLILVGTMPIAYALNRSLPPEQIPRVAALTQVTEQQLLTLQPPPAAMPAAREVLTEYVRTSQNRPQVLPALGMMLGDIGEQIRQYGSVENIPAQAVTNTRNDMYLASETIKHLQSANVALPEETARNLTAVKHELDAATRFIPMWVKVVVAIALGLGTMVGWRRIVVTVGERIGKTHLTYAQGASAELVAMATIGAADAFGLPVSTTHVLSSGVAGTMAANRSGLQLATLRNLALAWVLTLPVSVLLSGLLYALFIHLA